MENLARMLPLLGHRNWIAIVDSAYPLQARPGVETLVSNRDLLAEVRDTLGAIADAPHLRAEIFLDAELPHLKDADAPGIAAFRGQIKGQLAGLPIHTLPHDQILSKMAQVAETYKVVIIKTRQTLPYTSVFIELHCGYWSQAKEEAMRAALPAEFGRHGG